MTADPFLSAIKHNCDISDARDSGIYSICTLVLKLRNLYKWEHGLQPWEEPDPPVLLDWIASKEEYWANIQDEPFSHLPVDGEDVDPFLLPVINEYLAETNQAYGAGYGRSMKAVFFLAEILENRQVENCPVLILGREEARELSSPFAMLQNGVIYIRKEPMRFFFWDQIQEISPASRAAIQVALSEYDIMQDGCALNRHKLIETFDDMVAGELNIFIYHEIGESRESTLASDALKRIIDAYPASALELLARSVKDILADTHPEGLLSHIVALEKKSSLAFYIAFLDGMRKLLCPELSDAAKLFWQNGDWSLVQQARQQCRDNSVVIATRLNELSAGLERGEPPEKLRNRAQREILAPLGLQVPEEQEEAAT